MRNKPTYTQKPLQRSVEAALMYENTSMRVRRYRNALGYTLKCVGLILGMATPKTLAYMASIGS